MKSRRVSVVAGRLCVVLVITALPFIVACAAPAPAPAEFEVVSLDVMPPKVTAGEAATIKAQVKNSGGSEGVYTVILTVDGVKVEEKDITVAAGATVAVTFQLVKEISGTYKIAIGDLSSSLTVKEELIVKEVELKYDDGKADGFCSQGPGWGYSVHFSPSATPFVISKVRVMAGLCGTGYAGQKALLEIWSQDFDILYSREMPTAEFSRERDWVTVETDITVDGDFRVVFFTSGGPKGGICVGYDLSGINKGSEVAKAGGTIVDWIEVWETGPGARPRETTNWMIRVVGTMTAVPAPTLTPGPGNISDLYDLPEIKDGISAAEAQAIETIKQLFQSSDPEVQQGLQLISKYGIPPENAGKYMPTYPIPDYNTQLQALFWLALDRDIDEDYDRMAVALALDYGIVATYGDDQVDEAAKQYICQVYDYVRETDQYLRDKSLDWEAKRYPLETDMLLVWGACGMRYPTFYEHVGQTGKTPWTHFWYAEFQERPMNIEDFNWLFVSVEALKEMRDWTVQKGFARNDIGRVADNIDSYAGKNLHYYTDKPGVPPSYVEVEGKITPGCRLSNPDWQWKSLKEKNEFLGNCEDTLYVVCMLLKSLNIAGGKGNVKAEGFGHAVILYYDVKGDVLRTTPNQLGIIDRHAEGEIVYRYYHLPWDNLHQLRDSIVITESSDKRILEKGISTEYVLKWR